MAKSKLQAAYTDLQHEKALYCRGESTKKNVRDKAKRYKSLAVKAGQKASDVDRKTEYVTSCKCSSNRKNTGKKV